MKSDYQYSASTVYNNFPWPEHVSETNIQTIKMLAQEVIDARAQFPDSSLADLYDPRTMPQVLRKSHNALDRVVDQAYGFPSNSNVEDRIAFLFDLHKKYKT